MYHVRDLCGLRLGLLPLGQRAWGAWPRPTTPRDVQSVACSQTLFLRLQCKNSAVCSADCQRDQPREARIAAGQQKARTREEDDVVVDGRADPLAPHRHALT